MFDLRLSIKRDRPNGFMEQFLIGRRRADACRYTSFVYLESQKKQCKESGSSKMMCLLSNKDRAANLSENYDPCCSFSCL